MKHDRGLCVQCLKGGTALTTVVFGAVSNVIQMKVDSCCAVEQSRGKSDNP